MTNLLSLDSDYMALMRGGCEIRFTPLPSMFGVVEIQVTVTPNSSPVISDIWLRELDVRLPPIIPFVFSYSVVDEDALAKGFQQARLILLGQLPGTKALSSPIT